MDGQAGRACVPPPSRLRRPRRPATRGAAWVERHGGTRWHPRMPLLGSAPAWRSARPMAHAGQDTRISGTAVTPPRPSPSVMTRCVRVWRCSPVGFGRRPLYVPYSAVLDVTPGRVILAPRCGQLEHAGVAHAAERDRRGGGREADPTGDLGRVRHRAALQLTTRPWSQTAGTPLVLARGASRCSLTAAESPPAPKGCMRGGAEKRDRCAVGVWRSARPRRMLDACAASCATSRTRQNPQARRPLASAPVPLDRLLPGIRIGYDYPMILLLNRTLALVPADQPRYNTRVFRALTLSRFYLHPFPTPTPC